MEPFCAHVTLNPLVNYLATAFFGFTERWILRIADSTFVTKIFTIRRTVIITFVSAALISITCQFFQVLSEFQTRSSLWSFLRGLTGSLLNEVLLILLSSIPCFVSGSLAFCLFSLLFSYFLVLSLK